MKKYFELSTDELENYVVARMRQLEIKGEDFFNAANCLHMMKAHDLATYEHCLRVGLMSAEVGENVKLRPKPLFLSGILHDYGKVSIDGTVLHSAEFTDDDYERIKIHPLVGYEVLKMNFPFSAEVLVRHHCFGKDPYPKDLPACDYPEEIINEINYFARFLALIDYYDAINTRDYDKFEKTLTTSEKLDTLLKDNNDIESLVKELINEGLFV